MAKCFSYLWVFFGIVVGLSFIETAFAASQSNEESQYDFGSGLGSLLGLSLLLLAFRFRRQRNFYNVDDDDGKRER